MGRRNCYNVRRQAAPGEPRHTARRNELVRDGIIYDLHNCYDFEGIAIATTRRVQLWFTPSLEHGKGLASIALDMEDVDFLELSRGVALGVVKDLDEIGYRIQETLNWTGSWGKVRQRTMIVWCSALAPMNIYGFMVSVLNFACIAIRRTVCLCRCSC
jgi:hypothetical protein